MQEFVRQYGKYIITFVSFMVVMGILASTAIFPQYGLLSYLGDRSKIEADHLEGDYTTTTETNAAGESVEKKLYENQDISFWLKQNVEAGKTYHINYNKGKTLYPDSCLLETDKDDATITIVSVINNNGKDALSTQAKDSSGNYLDCNQVDYVYYNYTDINDNLNNYKNDDGFITFNESGIYSIVIEAKWNNDNGEGYSTRKKSFKLQVL